MVQNRLLDYMVWHVIDMLYRDVLSKVARDRVIGEFVICIGALANCRLKMTRRLDNARWMMTGRDDLPKRGWWLFVTLIVELLSLEIRRWRAPTPSHLWSKISAGIFLLFCLLGLWILPVLLLFHYLIISISISIRLTFRL